MPRRLQEVGRQDMEQVVERVVAGRGSRVICLLDSMGSFEEALDRAATTLRGPGRWCMNIHRVIGGCGDTVVAVRAMAAV